MPDNKSLLKLGADDPCEFGKMGMGHLFNHLRDLGYAGIGNELKSGDYVFPVNLEEKKAVKDVLTLYGNVEEIDSVEAI